MSELTTETLDERLDELLRVVKEGFDATASKEDVHRLEDGVSGLETRLLGVEERLTRVEATMVTKTYLDDKLADLKGDLIVKMRRADDKLNFVIHLLRARSLLSEADCKTLETEYQIFPHLSV